RVHAWTRRGAPGVGRGPRAAGFERHGRDIMERARLPGGSMSTNQARVVARAALVIVAVLSLSGCDWMLIHSSAGNSGAAVDPGFGPDQIANLTLQWRFHPGNAIESTPVTAG